MNEYLRDLRDGDLEYLAENLREADKKEVLAYGSDLLPALQESVELSYYTKIIEKHGVTLGILGLCQYDEDRHAIWMVATPDIEKNSAAFLRHSRPMIDKLFEVSGVSRLMNFTYAENELHHKWLSWCGAVISRTPVFVGPDQKPFFPFVIER